MRIPKLISKLNNKHVFSLAGNGATAGFTIVIMAMLYRFLPTISDVGNWVFFLTVYGLVEMFRMGFLTTATIKFYAGADKDTAQEIIGSSWLLATLITLGLVLLNIPALLLLKVVHIEGLAFFLKWFGLSYLLSLPWMLANCVLQAENRFDRLFYTRMVTQVSFMLSLLVFILMHKLTLERVVFCNLFSYFVTSMYVLLKGWTHLSSWKKISRRGIMKLYHFGKYSVMGNISSSLLRTSDIFIIGFMFPGDKGQALVAIYNFGLRLMEIIEIPLRSLVATAMPSMATAYNNGNKEQLIYIMKKYAGTLTLALIPVCVASVLLADVAAWIISPTKMVGTAGPNVLRLFMTFAILFPTDRFLALTLDVIHKPNINFYKILIMLAVNVTGDILGILALGNIYGVAITTVFPTLVGVYVGYRALQKYHPFHLRDIYRTGWEEVKLFIRNTLKFRNSVG